MENQTNAITNEMTQEREAVILERAISKFGTGAQILKAVEELGELSVELARDLNGLGRTEAIRGNGRRFYHAEPAGADLRRRDRDRGCQAGALGAHDRKCFAVIGAARCLTSRTPGV